MKLAKHLLILEGCFIAAFCYTLLPVTGDSVTAFTGPLYGEECETGKTECNSNGTLGLRCVEKKCACSEDRAYYGGICVANADTTCNDRPSDGTLPVFCTPNADCLKTGKDVRKCTCSNGYSKSDGECVATHGGQCASTAYCNPYEFLTCALNNTCVCNGGDVWDPARKTCVALIGSDCTTSWTGTKQCTAFSKCDSKTSKCTCPKGTGATSDNTRCVSNYGENCLETIDCRDSLSCVDPPTVDTTPSTASAESLDVSLMATLKQCSCLEGESYNSKTQVCEILANEKCDPKDSVKHCVENSDCLENKCTCKEFFESMGGKCAAGYGSSCSEDPSICNSKLYLTCDSTSSKCKCKADYTYDSNLKVCIGSVGSDCDTDKNCEEYTSRCVLKKCSCETGYVATAEKTCLAGYNTTCLYAKCNPADFLICSNTKCGCEHPETEAYDKVTKACVALSGGTCKPNGGGISCVGNATCSAESICACNDDFYEDENKYCVDNAGHGIYITTATIILSAFISTIM